MNLRMGYILLLILSIFLGPFWLSILIGFMGVVYFRYFWEAPVIFLVVDLLYAVPLSVFKSYLLVSTTSFLIILMLVEKIKQNYIYYYDK